MIINCNSECPICNSDLNTNELEFRFDATKLNKEDDDVDFLWCESCKKEFKVSLCFKIREN